jgi:N-ethylmaleimide reductase
MSTILFAPAQLGSLTLRNHLVMAPMTRNRATADTNAPTPLFIEYYRQRAGAGLIVTEGTSPAPNGTGYARIPGIYTPDQVAAWKPVTEAVHAAGGAIFMQLMHTGRIGHPANLPAGAELTGPSAIAAAGEIYTDTEGMQAHPTPRELTTEEVKTAVQEFVQAARNAIEAGFDGVELHGANGYFIEQFIRSTSNQRTDEYGGSPENRARFALEVAQAVAEAIGTEKTAIRLSPYGVFNDMPYEADAENATYEYLISELNRLGLVYLHLVDHSSMGAPTAPAEFVGRVRATFTNTLILSGGYDKARAEADLVAGRADLIAFGRPFLANPDLVERLQQDAPLNAPDFATFYTPGEKGYTDYPVLAEVENA